MSEKGEGREQSKPDVWETLASTEGSKSQDNGWNQSDNWGQSLNNDAKWKSDGWGMSSGQKELNHASWTRSRRSPCRNRNRFIILFMVLC
jgi:hypothetical protein